MPSSERIPLPGSQRRPVTGSRTAGKADPEEKIQVTLVLKPRNAQKESALVAKLGAQLPADRTYPTRAEFAKTFGSTEEEIAKVKDFASKNSLRVVEANSARRSVLLSGTVAQFATAFGVELAKYRHPRGGTFRGRLGAVYLSAELAPVVNAVLGLDNRPQARYHMRIRPSATPGVSYTAPQVAGLYDYPASLDGTGQTVGILELGGGYSPTDIQTYCSSLGIATPSVSSVSVDGATNSPSGDPNGPDGEVLLDIEVIGTIVPKASILVYFAPNTDAGFVDAITSALHATQGPSVVSISWGSAESEWTTQGMQSLDQAFQDAATLGVTVCAASGDGGSSDGVTDGLAHVDFPASSQYVLGCGGTRITVSGNKLTNQVVWDDLPNGGASGGGVSDVYALPSWQDGSGIPPSVNPGAKKGRGMPDVSGDASPETGYSVRVDGNTITVGGTSAVAPLWTGLLARVNQSIGKPVGYINPLLYQPTFRVAFRDVVSGKNGSYKAGPGWDACTGWGSPDGAKLLGALSQGTG